MASLRKRGSYYYIVFTRRVDGELEQRVSALRTDSKSRAERLRFELEEEAARGAFDPFSVGGAGQSWNGSGVGLGMDSYLRMSGGAS